MSSGYASAGSGEQAGRRAAPRWAKAIVALLALLPLVRLSVDGVSSILIFTVFAAVLTWEGLQRRAAEVRLPLPVLFFGYALLASGLTQLFVQLEGFETSFSAHPVIHFFQALSSPESRSAWVPKYQ